jgi:hypothetical protein
MALCRSMCVSVRVASVLILLVPARASAQATGTISGLVTDSTDAALPAVVLEVTNRATGLVRRSTTGPDGVYVVPLLPPGDYDVRGTLAGFSTIVREGVRVSSRSTAEASPSSARSCQASWHRRFFLAERPAMQHLAACSIRLEAST